MLTSLLFLFFAPLTCAQIIDLRNGREISSEDLAQQARAVDMLLLGELHDNVFHHRARGLFLELLAQPDKTIVSEHLPANSKVVFADATLRSLELPGFETKAWQWPLHESLFESIRATGYRLVGANLAKGVAKDLSKNGVSILSAEMRDAITRSALDAKSGSALDQDLIEGHCGQLPEKYLRPMQLIQRATDSSFALTMLKNKPAILIAGNGHVRKDYGVPQVINSIAPAMKVLSIGFHERSEDAKEQMQSLNGLYDYVWLTDAVNRTDPCQTFKIK